MTPRALFVGDLVLDTVVVAPHLPEPDEKVIVDVLQESIGGVAANAAAACALAGTSATLCSPIADDAGGQLLATSLAELSLETEFEREGNVTPRAFILLDECGEKRLLLRPGGRMYPSSQKLEKLALSDVAWVHTAIYDREPAATLIGRCRERGIPWSIDLEPATLGAGLDGIAEHLDGCETVFANSRAMDEIGRAPVARLLERGVRTVVETLGESGARLTTATATTEIAAPTKTAVRDTTGAGDALAGWFVSERVRGAKSVDALRLAVLAASLSVSKVGSVASYPTRRELELVSADQIR